MRRLLILAGLVFASPAASQIQNPPNAVVQSIADILQYVQPSSGSTVVMSGTSSLLVIDNPSLLATLTVTLPANPVDGQRAIITSGAGVTILTVNGGTVKGLITSLSINGYARFAYSQAANAWFRTG